MSTLTKPGGIPRRALLLVMAGIVSVSPCNLGLRAATIEDEEYSVYDVVIETTYLGPETKQVVIQSQTTTNSSTGPSRDVEKEFRLINDAFSSLGLGADTLASYFSKNKDVYALDNHFMVRVPAVVVRPQELDALRKSGRFKKFWRGFYRKYPQARGLIAFYWVRSTQRWIRHSSMCNSLPVNFAGAEHTSFLSNKAALGRSKKK